ncbi:vicilin-like seed storage protein At2g18540 [Coffea eugenioides]|uniref:UBA domain-containing protein n=1 Tax=Coffea arabica TaxID=13443 RepID=A0A6P6WUA3_COFAR|nr:vicilin-like seed storage protein At2g18540 [Coffea arabica]XP_027164968.1 vicilin-like seed storage protein At2g18540 [Coffea eugenioides]
MAGVSLQCGDCGTLLKSVEEAQEHAELTKHTNFSESTEPVLNLVCTSCGKPCRSKTESNLHTKRTGHAEFVDKTSEATAPISLEAPKVSDDVAMGEAGDSSSSGQQEEMVVPEVDQKLLEELEAMGFPKGRATRALHYSGNASLEAAVNWVVEHENDPDIDEMPLVPASAKKSEASKPSLTPEEIKKKQQELRERARKKKEEEEKIKEREREKERIRVGRELLEAKRIEEENERKRLLLLRKAEKEEERKALEKVRQKMEEDKAERRRKLGLPPEDPSTTVKRSAPVVEEKKSSLPVRPATKAEQMRECLRSLKQNHKDDDAKVKTAFNTLLTFAKNVATNPNEEKFRKIRLTNAAFQDRVGKLKGGIEFLELCGFEKLDGGEFLFLPREKVDIAVLNTAGSELNSAINNPFFGVL